MSTVVSLTCISDIVMKDGLCEKKKHLCKKWCILCHAVAPTVSVFIMTDGFFASSQPCVCALHVWSEKKRGRFLLKKCRERDINLRDSRWDVTENGGLKGRQACSSGEKRKHQSWNPQRMCSGSCWMLKTRPGSVCVCACAWACLALFYMCVDAHWEFECVCKTLKTPSQTPLKMPSQTPLFWGGNGQ